MYSSKRHIIICVYQQKRTQVALILKDHAVSALCCKSNACYSHYRNGGKEFLQGHLGFPPSSCIHFAHLKEVCTHAQRYIPVQKSNTKLITQLEVKATLQVESREEQEQHPIILCPKHYQELYHKINSVWLLTLCQPWSSI